MKEKKPIISVTIKDLIVQTFRCGGKGGQKQNKTDSGVRLKHKPSGAMAECRETRSQHKNKRIAFERLGKTKEFQNWIKLESHRKLGLIDDADPKEIKRKVDEQMKKVKVEGKDEKGRWVNLDN